MGEITYNVVSQPNGTLTGAAPNLAYTVTPDSLAPDSLSFTVKNEVGESAPAPVSISVKETNHPPAAGEQTLVLQYGAVGEVILQGTDEDGDALSFVIDSNPDSVACLYPPTCYVLSTEESSEVTTKSFSYHVDDGTAVSASATVTIVLEPTFSFHVPDANDALLTNAGSVTLEWRDAPSSGSLISIYAGGTLPENLIAADIPESDPANAFSWDISALPDGDYPISAMVADEWTTRWVDGGTLVIDRTPPQVSVDLAEGLYATYQTGNFTVSETADVHCTTDGSDPTAASPNCYSRVLVHDTMTLKFIAVDPAGNVSPMLTKCYIIDSAPLSVGLNPSSIAENQAVGTPVGTLSTSDPDSGDSFTYALDPDLFDNNSFQIVGGALQSAASFNYEAKNSYSILLRSTDQDGLSVQTTHTIVVTDVNDPPTAIVLSASQVAEHLPAGTTIGTLSTSDEDAGSTFSYSLVSVTQTPDNAFFQIAGNVLKTNAEFVYTLAKHSYAIRVRSTDQGGQLVELDLTITILDVNENPTDIALSAISVLENQPSGTVVGNLSTTDPDVENTFKYTLDSGGVDNSYFQIVGNGLQTAASFNYETRHSYSVMVRSTDQGGLFLSKNFTITVTNANDPPSGIALNNASVVEKAVVGSPVGTLSSTDEDPGSTFTYTLTTGSGSADNAAFQIVGTLLKTNAVFTWQIKPSYTVMVRTTDQGGSSTEQPLAIAVRRRRVRNDFDGDRRSDIGLFHPAGGTWYEFRSTEGYWQTPWGYSETLPLTGDFDSDGKSDIGLYYPSGGNWYLMKSTEGYLTTQFGYTGTIPFTGDFDGDGREDFGCYEAATGKWFVMKSLMGFWQAQFGYAGTIPIIGDFDGDGWDDIGCYYPPGGNWHILKSTQGYWQAQFGYAGTIPVVGDFDGDGRSDIGCYYPPGGNWHILKSTQGYWQTTFGFAGTEPVVGDFDGDGKSDIGCYYPAGGNWYLLKSTEGLWQKQFGFEGTIPLGGTLR